MENITFRDLGLNSKVLKSIEDMGFEKPSEIQEAVIPVLLKGSDVIGQAQTGTGKTLAFGAPVISNIEAEKGKVKCLVLAPTRELAVQVNEELIRIAKYKRLNIVPIYGGQSIDRQIRDIRRGVDIVVGTPGRVLDLIRRKVLVLEHVEYLILDEADEMLNMGFIEDIEEVIKNLSDERQTLLFSATMPNEIKKLARKYMKDDYEQVSILKKEVTVSTVKQFYYEVRNTEKLECLCRTLDVDDPTGAIIFCKTKKGVDELVTDLSSRGYFIEGMHGDMSQNQRSNTLRKFKEGTLKYLAATDVAARGIDAPNISHVINYDLPQDTESYVHRIGRTGRANREGVAYTLINARQSRTLREIEKITKGKINRKKMPTQEDVFTAKYSKLCDEIKETLAGEDFKKFLPFALELKEEYNLKEVTAALISMIYTKEVGSVEEEETKQNFTGEYTRLFWAVGKKDKVNPKILLEFIDKSSGIKKDDIGDIDILENFTFTDVRSNVVEDIMSGCIGNKINSRKVRIEVANSKR